MGAFDVFKRVFGQNGIAKPFRKIGIGRGTQLMADPRDYERWDDYDTDPSGMRADQINPRNEILDFLELYQVHPWVFSAVSSIATAAASVEYQILDEDGEETNEEAICKLFCKPNPHQVWYELKEMTMSYLELCGNAFWEEVKIPGTDRLIAIYPLRPDKMKILPHPKVKVAGYIYEVRPGKEILFGIDDITHIKYFSPIDEYWGISAAYAAQNSIILDMNATVYNKKFFSNSAVPEGVLETEGSLSDSAYKRLLDSWKRRHKGLSNAFEMAILEEGLKYKPIGFSQRDMQMSELKKLSREEILSVYRVPPVMVGLLEHANYASSREQKKMFWMDNVLPKLKKIQEVINANLMPGKLKLKYKTDSIHSIIEDVQIATQVSMSLVSHGIMTINEVRKKYHALGPVEWGDKPWLPVGLAQVDSGMHPQTPNRGEFPQPEAARTQDAQQAINQSTPMGGSLPREEQPDFEKMMIPDPDWNDKEKVRLWKSWNIWKGLATPDYRELRATFRTFFEDQLDRILPRIESSYPEPKAEDRPKNKVEKLIRDTYEEPYLVIKASEFKPEVERMLFDVKEEAGKLKAKFIPKARKILSKHGKFMTRELGASIDFNLRNPRIEAFLKDRAGAHIADITKATRERLGRELSKAIELGEDFKEVKERLAEIFKGKISEGRANAIARTETITLTQFGRLEGAIQSGVVRKKRWVSQLLPTTRDTHRDIHDTEVEIEEHFKVDSRSGVDEMYGPGDPAAQPENIVNCVCFLDFPGSTPEFFDVEEEEFREE